MRFLRPLALFAAVICSIVKVTNVRLCFMCSTHYVISF